MKKMQKAKVKGVRSKKEFFKACGRLGISPTHYKNVWWRLTHHTPKS